MRFQTEYAICTHLRGMDDARRQIEAVACFERVPRAQFD